MMGSSAQMFVDLASSVVELPGGDLRQGPGDETRARSYADSEKGTQAHALLVFGEGRQ